MRNRPLVVVVALAFAGLSMPRRRHPIVFTYRVF
jgi:hypothetical protein